VTFNEVCKTDMLLLQLGLSLQGNVMSKRTRNDLFLRG